MRANIFIRQENEARWKALKDKSGWINDMLRRGAPLAGTEEDPESKIPAEQAKPVVGTAQIGQTVSRVIKTPKDAEKAVESLKPVSKDNPSIRFCKNDHPIPQGRDKCTGKGCKYSK